MTMSGEAPVGALPPLKITCKSTKCEENKHCFLPRPKRRGRKEDAQTAMSLDDPSPVPSEFLHPEQTGRCRACDAALIDWGRIHRRDLDDASYTIECLGLEFFRSVYWTLAIDDDALAHARKNGLAKIRKSVERRMRSKKISRGVIPGNPTFDGRQTPLSGNVIFYAQHATATCCRKCMEVWHRIPRDRDMTDEEIRYAAGLNMLYILERLPDLTEEGEGWHGRKRPAKPVGAGEDA